MTIDFTKPVRTRGGQPARILCTDHKQSGYPIVAVVGQFEEFIVRYDRDGRSALISGYREQERYDLVNIPVKHKGWINITKLVAVPADGTIYTHGNVWPSKHDAINFYGTGPRVACIEVEFEEGQGLPGS